MLEALITLLILGLVLYLIWWFVGKFITGFPYQVIGIILGLIWLIWALKTLGLFGGKL